MRIFVCVVTLLAMGNVAFAAMQQPPPSCGAQNFYRTETRIYVGCEVAPGQYMVFDFEQRTVRVMEIIPAPEVIDPEHEDFLTLQYLFISAGTFGAMQGTIQGYQQGYQRGRDDERRAQETDLPVCHPISYGDSP